LTDNGNISGATSATLTLLNVMTADAGSYDCVVNNDAATVSSAPAILTVNKAPATVTLTDLTPTYDGTPKNATSTTIPTGLAVQLTYDGSATAPVNAGTYAVVATVSDPNYTGSATGSLVIAKASAALVLGGLNQTYDGSPRAVTVDTTPANLAVVMTYNGNPAVPTNAGTYAVSATVTDPNYTGTIAGTLVIAKAPAVVTLGNLSQIYDGSAKTVNVTTTPAGLPVTLTYNGSTSAPIDPGTYTVTATVNDANYAGSATGTLVIANATATITLGNLTATYDGAPKPATFTTTPSGLAVTLTYNGSATPPTNAGTYAVAATINAPGYTGTASGTLTVGKAVALVTLGSTTATYDGTPKSATATTQPAGLTVVFKYDGVPAVIVPPAGQLTAYAAAIGQTLYVTATGATSGAVYGTSVHAINSDVGTAAVHAGVLTPGQTGVLQIAILADAGSYTGSTQNGVTSQSASAAGGSFHIAGLATTGYTLGPVNAGTVTVNVTVIDPNYTGSATGTLTIAKATPLIAWSAPTAIVYGTPLGAAQLNATATVPGAFTYNPPAGTILAAGANQPLAVVFTPADAVNYTTATAATAITVNKAVASVTLSNLNPTYNGSPRPATATTVPTGLPVMLTYDGNATAPTNAGSYTVVATIADANYTGSASGTLTIAKATATVTLGNLSQIYNGSPKSVTAVTTPTGLPVLITYNGSATAPSNVGTYAVVATINQPNYSGSASGTLVIAKATATLTLTGLKQAYDGTPRVVVATTNPAALSVTITYNGNASAPVSPGTYTVVATITDANYAGSVTDTLTVTTTALLRHAPTLDGGLDGSVQIASGESVTLNGNAWVSGDLLVPGTPTLQLNGHPTYAGIRDGTGSATPANYTITLNGNALLRYLVRRTDAIALPVVSAPPTPTGTRDVTINTAGQNVGDFTTVRNLTLNSNGGLVAVPPGTYGSLTANGSSGFILGVAGATAPAVYNLQGLTLNGNTQVQIVGPVVLLLNTGPSINGTIGSATNPTWLTLKIFSGGVTLNGNIALHGFVIAPNGAVTINGNSTLNGGVVADRLTINGNGLLNAVDP